MGGGKSGGRFAGRRGIGGQYNNRFGGSGGSEKIARSGEVDRGHSNYAKKQNNHPDPPALVGDRLVPAFQVNGKRSVLGAQIDRALLVHPGQADRFLMGWHN